MDDETADEQRRQAALEAEEQEAVERDAAGRFGQGNPFRFSPGTTGNPNGRPKGIARLLKEIGESSFPSDAEKVEIDKRILQSLAARAAKGNVPAIREWCDRRWGRVPVALKLGGEDDGGGPTDFRIRIVGRDDVERDGERLRAKGLPPPSNGNGNGDGLA